MAASWFLLGMFVLATLPSHTNSAPEPPTAFSIPVIHSSRLSPFLNTTSLDLIESHYYKANFSVPVVELSVGQYFAVIYIGSPRKEVYLLVDTRSSLTWLQCAPCHECDPAMLSPYDPLNSNTFKSSACDAAFCKVANTMGCTNRGDCGFVGLDGDSSRLSGLVAIDTVSFPAIGESTWYNKTSFIFGCAHYDFRSTKVHQNGIFGLGRGGISILSQYSITKFSHCLPPPEFNKYQNIEFGSSAKLLGQRAHLLPSPNGYYILELESITCMSKVSHAELKVAETYHAMIIDTSSKLTYLHPAIFVQFYIVMESILQMEQYDRRDNNCYLAMLSDVAGLEATFHFDGFDVEISNMLFFQDGDYICLGIRSGGSSSILGANSLINFNVGYDLENMEVWFQKADCTVS